MNLILFLITEILSKYPNVIVSRFHLALPGYSMFLNFDPDVASSYASDIRGAAIIVSDKLTISEIDFP